MLFRHSISSILLLMVFMTPFSYIFAAPVSGTLDTSYGYRKQITITNNVASTLPVGYSATTSINHVALVSAGKSNADGSDVRIGYWNGTSWAELDRALDVGSAWNSAATTIWFKTQATISSSGTDDNYFIFYGKNSASLPSYDTQSTSFSHNLIRTKILTKVNSVLALNHGTFGDNGTEFWAAAPGYSSAYAADAWYAFTGYPSYFTATQIKNFAQKFIDKKDGSGNFPISINTAGTAGSFYSGCDSVGAHVTGDAMFFVPMMAKLHYDKSADITFFNTNATAMKTALANITKDGTSKLVNIPVGEKWIPWGFHDGIENTGNDLMGSLLYYKAARDMASLYTAAGDSANASFFTTEADNIENNLYRLWNSASGMFFATTGQNDQIDILGSAYAVYLDVIPAASSTAISNYLVTNFDAITQDGYVRQSPTNWENSWNTLGDNQCGRGTGNYDDGYWSVGNEWIATALAVTSSAKAVELITDYSNAPDLSMENFGATSNGFTNNTASVMGALKFVNDNPSLFTVTTSNIATADYSNVFTAWDDFATTTSQWSDTSGVWYTNQGLLNQSINTAFEDVKRTDDVGLSDNFLAQGDIKINSFTAADHSSAGLCINSTDTGDATARGYCSAFRGSDTSNVYILNERVAWGSGSAFSWTTGTWYRTKIARIGATIFRKTWAVGNSEPAGWSETYSQGNNLTSTKVSLLGGYSTTAFDNFLVRKYVTSEPSTILGSEVINNVGISSIVGAVAADNNAATVTWNTIKNSSTQVEYGTSISYGVLTSETDTGTRVTSHTKTLSGLNTCTTYHYRVISNDDIGISGTSDDNTFVTGGCVTATPASGVISTPAMKIYTAEEVKKDKEQKPQEIGIDNLKEVRTNFVNNLQLHSAGNDVKALQKFLNVSGFTISKSGPGSSGKETTYYGVATMSAVKKFQAANKLPVTGFFGPLTRAKILLYR